MIKESFDKLIGLYYMYENNQQLNGNDDNMIINDNSDNKIILENDIDVRSNNINNINNSNNSNNSINKIIDKNNDSNDDNKNNILLNINYDKTNFVTNNFCNDQCFTKFMNYIEKLKEKKN